MTAAAVVRPSRRKLTARAFLAEHEAARLRRLAAQWADLDVAGELADRADMLDRYARACRAAAVDPLMPVPVPPDR